eukprot:TRINITY_DN79838_c0_g1_i1.p1 TRINITY_DN79838_c0_g1~~TRINITY_DN79838_c0_g1_i1.p1  ORF type:complete len:301 (+),score=79.22 TRINITY_DN79838_c0_g1_i1:194-1096(+)
MRKAAKACLAAQAGTPPQDDALDCDDSYACPEEVFVLMLSFALGRLIMRQAKSLRARWQGNATENEDRETQPCSLEFEGPLKGSYPSSSSSSSSSSPSSSSSSSSAKSEPKDTPALKIPSLQIVGEDEGSLMPLEQTSEERDAAPAESLRLCIAEGTSRSPPNLKDLKVEEVVSAMMKAAKHLKISNADLNSQLSKVGETVLFSVAPWLAPFQEDLKTCVEAVTEEKAKENEGASSAISAWLHPDRLLKKFASRFFGDSQHPGSDEQTKSLDAAASEALQATLQEMQRLIGKDKSNSNCQ